jgi:hypothetical protein
MPVNGRIRSAAGAWERGSVGPGYDEGAYATEGSRRRAEAPPYDNVIGSGEAVEGM